MPASSVLFEQGDEGDAIYVVCGGTIGVEVNGREVNRLGANRCIGEMAVLDRLPRSATCVVREDARLLKIPAEGFESLIKSQTFAAFAVLRTLGNRLRARRAAETQSTDEESSSDYLSAPHDPPPAPNESTEQPSVLYRLLETTSFLQRVSLFEGLSAESLASIAEHATEVPAFAGERLFKQGDEGDALYLIREGRPFPS